MKKDEIDKLKEEHLKSKLSAMGEISSYIFHEVNNYIFVLGMNLDMIKLHLSSDNPKKDKIISILDKEAKIIQDMSNTFDNLKKDLYPLRNELDTFNLNNVLSEFLVFYKKLFHNINIEMDIEEYNVKGNQGIFLQVLIQVLNNIREANSKASITIKVNEIDNEVNIKLIDNGFDAKTIEVDKFFNKGFSTKESLGLGLDLSMKLMIKLNGKIEIQKNNNKIETSLTLLKAG
jgi:signal transduction histidine kinase